MKILSIHPFYLSSVYKVKRGSIRYEQEKRLAERGHSVYVVSCKTFGAPSFERVGNIEIYRVPAFTLPVLEYPFPNLLMLYSWVVKIAHIKKVDVIQVTDGGYPTSFMIPRIKHVLKRPVVVTVIGFPGLSWFYGVSLIDFIGKLYTHTFGKRLLGVADKLMLSATCLKEDAVRLGVSPSKVEFVPRGVDTQVFRPNPERRESLRGKLGIGNDDIVILFAGRLVPVKGVMIFVEAAKRLVEQNERLKFLIAGDGVLRGKCEKEARAYKENIRCIGYWNNMSDVMNMADIFVLSSISEGCPNAVLEAGACSKPVIASDVGAVRDIIVDGDTGLIIPSKDVDELCNAIERVVANLESLEMGEKGLRRVRECFSWDLMTSKCEKVYFDALESQAIASKKK